MLVKECSFCEHAIQPSVIVPMPEPIVQQNSFSALSNPIMQELPESDDAARAGRKNELASAASSNQRTRRKTRSERWIFIY
jgi:hypothetical protein